MVYEGPGPGSLWAMYIKQVSKSPSLNFAWTNSFGPDMPTAKIINHLPAQAKQECVDLNKCPTKRTNELVNVEYNSFSYVKFVVQACTNGLAIRTTTLQTVTRG